MRKLTPVTVYASAMVCAMAATLTGCESMASGSESASPVKTTAQVGSSVQVTGMLTLKGPEVGAWWALADASSGVVWRLESSSPEQLARWRQWQNQRVEVQGTTNGTYLSNPRLQVTGSSLKAQ
jgi:predicted secreted Zn-dependent protease